MENDLLVLHQRKADVQSAIRGHSPPGQRNIILQGGEVELQVDKPSGSSGTPGADQGALADDRLLVFPPP